jgi:hypothetical protein
MQQIARQLAPASQKTNRSVLRHDAELTPMALELPLTEGAAPMAMLSEIMSKNVTALPF